MRHPASAMHGVGPATGARPGRFAAVVLLGVLVAATGCAASPVSPLPIQPPPPSSATPGSPVDPAGSPSAPVTAAAVGDSPARDSRPQRTRPRARATESAPSPSPEPQGTSSCLGAVRYDLDLRDDTALYGVKSMCFAVGGVLRVQGVGPGMLGVEPPELVSTFYEAAVVDIRFVRPGTVTVTITDEDAAIETVTLVHTITVVVRP